MKEVSVAIFGTDAPMPAGCCCCEPSPEDTCCGSAKTMQEEAENLKEFLVEKFGNAIQFNYVDVQSDEMNNYPDISAILDRVRLPLTVINGEPRFHGGFSNAMISEAVSDLL